MSAPSMVKLVMVFFVLLVFLNQGANSFDLVVFQLDIGDKGDFLTHDASGDCVRKLSGILTPCRGLDLKTASITMDQELFSTGIRGSVQVSMNEQPPQSLRSNVNIPFTWMTLSSEGQQETSATLESHDVMFRLTSLSTGSQIGEYEDWHPWEATLDPDVAPAATLDSDLIAARRGCVILKSGAIEFVTAPGTAALLFLNKPDTVASESIASQFVEGITSFLLGPEAFADVTGAFPFDPNALNFAFVRLSNAAPLPRNSTLMRSEFDPETRVSTHTVLVGTAYMFDDLGRQALVLTAPNDLSRAVQVRYDDRGRISEPQLIPTPDAAFEFLPKLRSGQLDFRGSVKRLNMGLTFSEPLPTVFAEDSLLNFFDIQFDADGDPSTGFVEPIFPNFGMDFSAAALNTGPSHSSPFENFLNGNVFIWNPAKSGGDRTNSSAFDLRPDLIAYSLNDRRTQLDIIVDAPRLEETIRSTSGVSLDLANFTWHAISRQTTVQDNLGTLDILPDSSYSPQTRTLAVPDDFNTLQRAIDVAGPGDTIVLGSLRDPGRMETIEGDFTAIIDKPLRLVARRPGLVALDNLGEATLLIQNTAGVVIDGVVITGIGSGLIIQQAESIALRNVTLQQNGHGGLQLSNSRNVRLDNVIVFDHDYVGVDIFDSDDVVIENSTVSNNTEVGLQSFGSTLTISNSTVAGTKFSPDGDFADGVLLLDGTQATLIGNVIANNLGVGLVVIESSATIIDNTISGNGDCGIFQSNSSITARGNDFANNGGGNECFDQ